MKSRCQPLTFLLLGLLANAIFAQGTDSFEGGEPRWRLVESDCNAQLTEHNISLIFPHNGRTSEMFEVACSDGTLVLLAYPVEPSTIIEEFRPQLWTRCSSGRLQLGVRVVFPFAAHPVTGGRLTTVLWGDQYTETGQWQALEVSGLRRKLQEELVAIRGRFGSDLKLDGGYIDCIVLNAYTGPGRYRVQLDDLNLRGMVPMAALGTPPPPNWRERWRWRHEPPSLEARYWASPNRPEVWLQHRKEPLAWVNSLGFNGVVLDRLPSRSFLSEARQTGLGVISPPPQYAIEYPEDALPALSGWLLGAAMDSRQSTVAQDHAERIAGFPTELRKPLIAEALEDYFRFSRVADEVIVPQPIPSAAGSQASKVDWLSQQLETTTQRSEGWVSINLGVPPTVSKQLETASRMLEPNGDRDSLSVEPLGFRHQVTSAVIAGARGLFFRTFRPLDIQNPADSAQIAALRWVQNDLTLWGPWLIGGQRVQPPTLSQQDWISGCWSIEQSYLLISQNVTPGSQHCTPPTRGRPLEFGFTTPNTGQQVFRLSGGRMERLETEATAAGLSWRIENPVPVETILLTSNPRVLNFARDHLETSAPQIAADQLEIVSHNMAIASRLLAARFPELQSARSSPEGLAVSRTLASAQRQIEAGIQALQTRQAPATIGLLSDASDAIQSVLFDSYQTASESLASPQSSPLVAYPAALGMHWRLADACERSQWREMMLPGGDLANLGSMLQAGWSQQRRLEDKVELRVELVPSHEQSGLRMAAYSKSSDVPVEGGYGGASLRVRSAGVVAKAGQLVRVSATARVLKSNATPGTGLLVYDNQVGPSLGQLVNGPDGATVPIELYRFIAADGDFRILAECRGECDIIIESINASVIEPAANESKFPIGSLVPELFESQREPQR